MHLKQLYDFKERDFDWWIFTLLPLVLTLIITPVIYAQIKNLTPIFILLIQQLLNYSIILSSTDLGLRSKSNRKKRQIAPPFLIILIALITLVCTYIYFEQIIDSDGLIYLSFLISIIFAYLSILLYNNNPESYNTDVFESEFFIKMKEQLEKKAEETFEAPKKESTLNVKWGDENS